MERKEKLAKYFSKKIVEMFSESVPDEIGEMKKEISYEEALAVLNHTISVIGKEAHFTLK